MPFPLRQSRKFLFLSPFVLAAAIAHAADAPADGPYTEKWPSGKNKIQASYKNGQLNGSYTEYHENGKISIKTNYKNGQLDGTYQEFDQQGQPRLRGSYVGGKRNGPFIEAGADGKSIALTIEYDKDVPKKINGADVFPRTKQAILAELKKIAAGHEFKGTYEQRFSSAPTLKPPLQTGKLSAAYEDDALAYLKMYRSLAGVPYEQLKLNPENDQLAQAISVYSQYEFDTNVWRPPNPHEPPYLKEVDRAFWTLATKGGQGSNIYDHHTPQCSLRLGLIDWMRDSNDHNLGALGHRRWLLYPHLEQVGFGEAGRMCAFYYHPIKNQSFKSDYIAWPPAGYVPVEYFGDEWAWNITLVNTAKYPVPANASAWSVEVRALDDHFNPVGNPLELNHKAMDTLAYGFENTLIWRPSKVEVKEGKRYRVDVHLGSAAPIVYLIEFISDGSAIPQ